jgi:hypothetical protein
VRNQFFGDINDYHKYGLLRTFVGNGDVKLGVCWMLTPDDGRHGDKIGYLNDPDRWRKYDVELLARLHEWLIVQQTRQVELIEQSDLLPAATYYRALMPDQRSKREAYFEEMLSALKGVDLIFFDPDNGLEVASKPYKGKPSRNHLYFRELRSAFESGCSVLVIQFFPFIEREKYIAHRVVEIKAQIGSDRVLGFCTANVVYFLVLHSAHSETLTSRAESACNRWPGQIQLCALAPLRELLFVRKT